MNSFCTHTVLGVCSRMDTGRPPELDWVYAQSCINGGRRKFLRPPELIFPKWRGKAMSSGLWWWTQAMCHKNPLFHLELEGSTDSWKKKNFLGSNPALIGHMASRHLPFKMGKRAPWRCYERWTGKRLREVSSTLRALVSVRAVAIIESLRTLLYILQRKDDLVNTFGGCRMKGAWHWFRCGSLACHSMADDIASGYT